MYKMSIHLTFFSMANRRFFSARRRLVVNMEDAGGELDVTCPLPEDLQVPRGPWVATVK